MPLSLDIIVVNDSAHIKGGGDRVAIASAIGLAEAGHRVTFFSAVGPVEPELLAHPQIETFCLGLADILRDRNRWRAFRNGFWNTAAAKSFRQLLRERDRRSTVVHVHSFTKALSASVPTMAADLGYRTVLSLHDYFLACPNGAYFVYPKMEVCTRVPLSADCLGCRCDARNHAHKIWRFGRTLWQNRVAELPHKLSAVIAVSRTNLETARTLFSPGTNLVQVPYPIDAAAGKEPVAVEYNDAFMFVGRIELYKGPQLLAEAGAAMGAKVVFCGDGPASDRVRALYPSAEMAGWQRREAIPQQLARARALVFTSLWPETFGLTAVEALAQGVPVIASRGTAAEESVVHGVNGLLFERGSVTSLMEMMKVLGDREVARKMGREAHRLYWSNPLTMNKHVERLEAVYSSVLLREEMAA